MVSSIGLYDKINKTDVKDRREIPIDIFLNKIQSGEWQDIIIQLRSKMAKSGSAEKQRLKRESLPYVTISGLFTARNNSGLSSHSGLLAVDIDNADPELTKLKLRKDRHVYAMFTSCSGTGLCVIFKIHPQKHLASFDGISEYLFSNYAIVIDQACKDLSRPRYISFDPDIFINDHADEFKQYASAKPGRKSNKTERKVVFIQSEFINIIEEIEQRQVDIVSSYQQWIKVGYALADKFGDEGREYFHRISQQGSTYMPDSCDKQYDSILRNLKPGGNPATIASFYWICKEAGIMITSATVSNISKRAATHKKANSTEAQSVQNIIQFPEVDADPELVQNIVRQIYAEDIFIEDVSQIEIGRIWVRNNGVRRNEITHQIHLNSNSLTNPQLKTLELKMREEMPDMDRSDISMILESDAVPEFNEIKDFFFKYRDVKGTGAIKRLADCLNSPTGTGTDYVERMLTKWLVGAIANIIGNDEAHTMLVLCGEKHGDGKSFFFKNLLPKELRHLTACKDFSVLSNESSKRDFEISITRSWLIFDDEMGGKSKRDHRLIKAMLAKSYTDVRAAYAKTEEHRKRISFFGGTANDLEILSDWGDNRRIIPIQIMRDGIDQEAKDRIDPIDYIMEAYHLYRSGYDHRILKEDIKFLNDNTEQFKETVTESELIHRKFRKPIANGEYMTGTDIKIILENITKDKINISKIKDGMRELGIKQELRYVNGVFGRYYFVEQIINFNL
jgi:predicted P-loop ATPase